MVDPRIYRAGLSLVAVAVIIFGFSLQTEPGADHTALAAPASAGVTAAQLHALASNYPDRGPGSPGDGELAAEVGASFRNAHAFTVSTQNVVADTSEGTRTVQLVTATRTGLTPGAIVVVAHRDAATSPDVPALSGTAVLLGLAHQLAGETQRHTVMLVSTSGSVGAAGATALANGLAGQPVDAVIVLGDLARARPSQPVIDPWSDGVTLAPPVLRQTLGLYVQAQTGVAPGGTGLGGQLAHLAFPLTTTEQAPFAGQGIPAVLVSLSGTRDTNPAEAISIPRMDGVQSAVLQTINALDTAPPVPAPMAYLTIGSHTVPLWAVRLLVLALILPVAMATVDALARTRRRGHSTSRWLAWALAGAVPFLLAWLALVAAGGLGVLGATPPSPVAGGVGTNVGEAAGAVLVVLLLLGAFGLLRPLCIRVASRLGGGAPAPSTPAGDAAAVSLLVVAVLATVVLWVINPFAAALVVPALHLWLWLAQPGVRAHRVVSLALALVGVLPAVLVAAYYLHSLGLGPLGLAHTLLLAVAGGGLGLAVSALWCLLLGCATSAIVIAVRSAGATAAAADTPVTVRGPVTYAGPGSLGGTKSAMGPRR